MSQKKAYDELDEVIGHDRSPDWSDEACLPYIDPIIKETLRWRSVTIPGGIPHAPIQDDIYNGYRIPAGTNITANLWTIHRHSREFPDPDKFEPESGFLERYGIDLNDDKEDGGLVLVRPDLYVGLSCWMGDAKAVLEHLKQWYTPNHISPYVDKLIPEQQRG
ncbi:hypothetical protein H2204_011300 [Knufia peltigerae]|uniref:Cytochrome P450 n=1 Tax=Knufia peltigerae TaxID=1002370 RepID=A0AA38XUE9_9EURO|nr:hypothetical protein H2204_011300 [Knufia peltigerae]